MHVVNSNEDGSPMTTLDPEQQRIRGYLQTQAAKLSIGAIVAKVRTDQEQVRTAAGAIPPARFAEHPADGAWSANEVMAHVVESGAFVAASIQAVLNGEPPPPVMHDQIRPDPPLRLASEWWRLLEGDRTMLFDRVARATGDERLDATWIHPFFGELNWREWLLFLRIHDLDHARQMQTIATALADGG